MLALLASWDNSFEISVSAAEPGTWNPGESPSSRSFHSLPTTEVAPAKPHKHRQARRKNVVRGPHFAFGGKVAAVKRTDSGARTESSSRSQGGATQKEDPWLGAWQPKAKPASTVLLWEIHTWKISQSCWILTDLACGIKSVTRFKGYDTEPGLTWRFIS